MPIMTYLNNIILIPATPSIRPNIWTTQSLPEPYWSTESIRGLLSSNSAPSPIKPILASPYKLHPLQNITHHSRSHWTQSLSDHSKQPGHSPWPPALFQANQELSWPLCTYPTHSKPSTPSPITCTQDPSRTIQIRPGLCWSIKSTTRPPTLFQVHSNLSWIFFVYRSYFRPSLPSPLLQNYAGPVRASQTTPDDQDFLQYQQHWWLFQVHHNISWQLHSHLSNSGPSSSSSRPTIDHSIPLKASLTD